MFNITSVKYIAVEWLFPSRHLLRETILQHNANTITMLHLNCAEPMKM